MLAKNNNTQFDDLDINRMEVDTSIGLSKILIESLNEICDRLEDSEKKSVLILRLMNQGSSNKDATVAEKKDVYLVNQWEKVLRRIENLDSMTVTETESDLNGFGLAIMLTTDYRITTDNITLSLIGDDETILPGMLIHRLVQQIGSAKARSLVVFGQSMSSRQAYEVSLVSELSDNLEQTTNEFLSSLNSRTMIDCSIRRRLLIEANTTSYDDALGTYLAACDRHLRKNEA